MQIDVVNMEGQKVGQMELADEVFGCKVREHLLWESVKAQRAAQRASSASKPAGARKSLQSTAPRQPARCARHVPR